MKKVFLDNLPKKSDKVFDWTKSIGYIVNFIYEDIEDEVTIINYDKIKSYLTILYKNDTFNIHVTQFKNAKFGSFLGKYTSNFKKEIGESIKDDKRDLVITDREYRMDKKGQKEKWYKYTCNKCGWTEGWIVEGALLGQGVGCSCCAGRTAVLGINTIWDTHKWLVDDFGLDEEFAKTHTYGTGDKGTFRCKHCGEICVDYISYVVKRGNVNCKRCSDAVSYPEKFIFNTLTQLNIEFKTQLSKTTFEWCDKYRYDFYIPSLNMIIEAHGEQHYIQTRRKNARTLQEEQENDKLKEQLAKENGIKHYIVIDCRESTLNWMKNNIINSKLNELFDLSKVDWNQCQEYTLKNIAKEVCDYWNNKEEWESATDLGVIFKKDRHTISKFLKRGSELGWCNYDPKEELRKGRKRNNPKRKPIKVYKDGVFIQEFESSIVLEKNSLKVFGVFLNSKNVSAVLNGRRKHHKGFTFSFV